MTAVILALGASLAWGFADFGAGLGARRTSVPLVIAVSQIVGLALVGLVVAVSRPPVPSAAQFAWGAAAGAVGLVALACFYRALAVGTMGIVGPITATAAVVPVAYGLTRGERPSLVQGIGVGLAFLGVVGASLEPAVEGAGRRVGAGVGLALLAALGFGGALVGLSRASDGGALWATLTMRLAGLPLVLAIVVVLRPALPGLGRRPLLLLLAAAGAFDTGATLLFGLATTRGLLSVVSVLASLYPVILVALGRLLLAERIARPQLAGVAAALAGVALVSAG